MSNNIMTPEMLMSTMQYKIWRTLEWVANAGSYSEIDKRFVDEPRYRAEFEAWVREVAEQGKAACGAVRAPGEDKP